MDDHDERIRQRVHEIWEEEGRPEGREYSHWLRARAEVREEASAPADASRAGADVLLTMPADLEAERTSKADIALNTLPPGTVPENPTAENPARLEESAPLQPTKPLDARDIDTQLDQPF
jgi:hypothetical protein